jgi:pentatricopeptide repeat protein
MEEGKYPQARPNEETYRVVFHVLGKFAGASETRALYDRLPFSIHPSAKLAAEVLLAYANADDGAGALAFLRHLRQAGPSPDGLCFSRAVLACGRAGMVEDARALLHEMQRRGMLGHSRSAGMVERLSKEEAWEEAAALFSAITETFASTPDVAPGPVALNTGLRVFCSVGDWEGVVCLLRQMASYGIQPTESNRAAALQAVGSAGQWPVATFLLEEAVLLQHRNVGTGGFAAWAQGVPDEVLTGFGPLLYGGLQRGGYVSHGHKEDGEDGEVQVVDFHGLGSRQSVCAVLALLQEMEKAVRAAEKEKKEVKARGSSSSSREENLKVPVALEGAVETSADGAVTATAEAATDGTSSDACSTATTVSANSTSIRGLVMVVGRGKNSPTGASVLAPYLVRALANPSFLVPPLTARQIPNNPGRIVLAKQEVSRYIKAQLKKGGGR